MLYLDAGRVHARAGAGNRHDAFAAGDGRLRIEYAVQVEGRRRRRGLTQHHMDLRSMVRLMVEQMAACHVRGLNVVFALVVRIGKRAVPERSIEPAEERLDPQVLARSRYAGSKSRRRESG